MKSILSKDFRYTNAASTNLKATFARVRREQDALKREREAKVHKIVPVTPATKGRL